MKSAAAEALTRAVRAWAIERDDMRAMALIGSWARGKPRQGSDLDLLLLTDRANEYRRLRKWLTEIGFAEVGYRIQSSETAVYGAVWSRHVHLLPAAEVELTFANCSWASIKPLDDGTRGVVKNGFRAIFDRDGILGKLTHAVQSA
jgi:predicted nucleotidyltransferase